jgi:NADP-dependent 3-hydroxy acid dehydrogenase YdfG
MKKTAFITGATSGIGRATALLLGQNGFRIIATGRRQERLEELKKELSKQTEIYTLPEDWKNIDLLVNNAGNAHGLA